MFSYFAGIIVDISISLISSICFMISVGVSYSLLLNLQITISFICLFVRFGKLGKYNFLLLRHRSNLSIWSPQGSFNKISNSSPVFAAVWPLRELFFFFVMSPTEAVLLYMIPRSRHDAAAPQRQPKKVTKIQNKLNLLQLQIRVVMTILILLLMMMRMNAIMTSSRMMKP